LNREGFVARGWGCRRGVLSVPATNELWRPDAMPAITAIRIGALRRLWSSSRRWALLNVTERAELSGNYASGEMPSCNPVRLWLSNIYYVHYSVIRHWQIACLLSQQRHLLPFNCRLIRCRLRPVLNSNVAAITKLYALNLRQWWAGNPGRGPKSWPTARGDSCRYGEFYYRAMHFSAKRGLAIACRPSVCPSVCDVGDLWSHRLEILETNCTCN